MSNEKKYDFYSAAEEAREIAMSFKNPLVVHHYDADGISSGAITIKALMDKGKNVKRMWIKTLDDEVIQKIKTMKNESGDAQDVIFVDLGSGHPGVDEIKNALVIDHHQPLKLKTFQFNPHLYGVDGSTELSASGSAYFVFKQNIEFGVVGAIGDMQYPFIGKNKEMLDIGVKEGSVVVQRDISFYGRYSRPLEAFLVYSDEPYIPGFSFNERAVRDLIQKLDLDPRKPYISLTHEQKQSLITAIVDLMIKRKRAINPETLIRDNYVFPRFEGTILYEAQELSTILNACGRNDKADIGVNALLGSKEALKFAGEILRVHRRNLREGVEYATKYISDMGPFYLIDARNTIKESIVGIICGMVMQNRKKPIIGIANSNDGKIKISGRSKVKQINLGLTMRKCASECGGIGGGHIMAAGAHIPENKINEFLLCIGEEFEKGLKLLNSSNNEKN